MINDIKQLNLPMGTWQKLIQEAVTIVTNVTCTYPDERTVHFQLFKNQDLVTTFKLSFLYGCRGILITHSMVVSPGYRGKGIGKKLQVIKQKIAKDLQVSALIGTVRDDNKIQKQVMKEWKEIDNFMNIRTGNKVNIFFKKI